MIYQVVGFRKVDFTDQKTRNHVAGYTLFLQRIPDVEENISGVEVLKQFIPSMYVDYIPALGDQIQFIYNRYGKISAVETC